MGATASVEGVSLSRPSRTFHHVTAAIARDGRYQLPRAVLAQAQTAQAAPSWNESDDLDTSSNRRSTHSTLPQCLVHAEHEILIFLYFKSPQSEPEKHDQPQKKQA
jgi:hypothetical protein